MKLFVSYALSAPTVIKIEAALEANGWANPATYANGLGPAPALFQYGLHAEDWVPLTDAKDYVTLASGKKQVQIHVPTMH